MHSDSQFPLHRLRSFDLLAKEVEHLLVETGVSDVIDEANRETRLARLTASDGFDAILDTDSSPEAALLNRVGRGILSLRH